MSHLFAYEVLLPSGASKWGVAAITVEQNQSARLWLEKQFDGLVVQLYRLPPWLSLPAQALGTLVRASLGAKELAGLMRDMAVMTASGIPIIDAIQSIAEDPDADASPRVAAVCRQLLEDLHSGASISGAFARQSDVFPDSVRSLAVIGDETGTMTVMLKEAADHIDRVTSMKADAKQAMIYPTFSFLAIFGAGGFWIVYVMPQLVGLFKQMNAELPPLTVAVLATATWLNDHGRLIAAGLACTGAVLVAAWRRSHAFRRKVYNVLHRLPIAKTILKSSGLAFFAEYLAILTRSGLDVVSSFHILEQAVNDLYYKDRIIAIRQYLARGDRISAAMRQVGGFPNMMVRMISVGEESGTLDQQLSYLSAEYAMRLKRTVDALAELIKPMVVVLAGGFFLLLIVALLLPVYDLVRQTMSGAH